MLGYGYVVGFFSKTTPPLGVVLHWFALGCSDILIVKCACTLVSCFLYHPCQLYRKVWHKWGKLEEEIYAFRNLPHILWTLCRAVMLPILNWIKGGISARDMLTYVNCILWWHLTHQNKYNWHSDSKFRTYDC